MSDRFRHSVRRRHGSIAIRRDYNDGQDTAEYTRTTQRGEQVKLTQTSRGTTTASEPIKLIYSQNHSSEPSKLIYSQNHSELSKLIYSQNHNSEPSKLIYSHNHSSEPSKLIYSQNQCMDENYRDQVDISRPPKEQITQTRQSEQICVLARESPGRVKVPGKPLSPGEYGLSLM